VSPGNVKTGGVVSTILTVKVVVAVSPCEFEALQVTVVMSASVTRRYFQGSRASARPPGADSACRE
jgi:hypothetical protein